MLLRQYKRVRSIKKKKFNYRDIKDVFIIVLYEQSTPEFHAFPNNYVHYFKQKSDTGLELPLLQKFIFVPLDIFQKSQHNNIKTKLDAWLLFLSSDAPKDILRLISEYPEFQAMYQQAYSMCRNLEDIMGFFSEELRIMDQNTVQFMMDEMQETIDQQAKTLKHKDDLLSEKERQLKELEHRLAELQNK